ncbi:hypothetical protein I4F81_002540 [Pyropia yezoensis]|uniref:Uncharacterized protein n=1 Tax=Pyropia yezoensis TaxID=2788 RepID=A0ACC3BQQ7_PYRYE|nr:hypothetical protein I4F81_002540 [Neopyropia yezoensis]
MASYQRLAPSRAALMGVAAAAAAAAASAAMAVAAAADGGTAAGGGAPLEPYASCSDLLNGIRAEAIARVGPYGMRSGGGGGPVFPVAVSEPETAFADDSGVAADSAGASGARAKGGGGEAGVDFSGTNEQVEGVAEADIVKTDGETVYALRGRSLRVVTTANGGAAGVETGVLTLSEYPDDMLLGGAGGGRLLIMASSYGELVPTPMPTPFGRKPRPIPVDVEELPASAVPSEPEEEALVTEAEEGEVAADAISDAPAVRVGEDADKDQDDDAAETAAEEEDDAAAETAAAEASDCADGDADGVKLPPGAVPTRAPRPHQGSITIVYTVDVSDGRAPKLVSTTRLQGRYLSSRSVDGVARLVIASAPPADLPYTSPGVRPRPGRFVRGLSEAEAQAANRALIAGTVLEDWFPRFRTAPAAGVRGGVTTGFVASCASTYRPASFSGFDLLSIVTLPLAADAPGTSLGRGTAVFAGGDTVYSSVGSVYVTTTNYQEPFPVVPFDGRIVPVPDSDGAAYNTSIHQFAVDDGTVGATYVGSGVVAGSVLNQFSMHEAGGTFFIATTLGAPWWRSRNTSVSEITSFRRADGAPADAPSPLVQVGKVGDLGRGERIYAVRYIGDVAYVVTFRQVDPLYIISLADPTDLVATGELKIPGFSTYLHPLDGGRLLGVGQDADDTGFTLGVKVSLFDVSDVRAPRELATWTETDLGSSSAVEWDHRAFLYWPPARLAVLPITSYGDDSFTGAVVLRLGDTRITEAGRIKVERPPERWETGVQTAAVERNVVLGRKWLWSLTESRFQVQALDGLRVSGSAVFRDVDARPELTPF